MRPAIDSFLDGQIDALEWEQPERHNEFIEKLPQKIQQLVSFAFTYADI